MRAIVAGGGGSQSALWCQIKADVTGLPVRRATMREATATGAAMLAARTLGWASADLPAGTQDHPAETFPPNPAHRTLYEEAFRTFTRLNQVGKRLLDPLSICGTL